MAEETQKIELTDRSSDFVGVSSREYTPEGYLKVKGRVARSGTQTYYGCELGAIGRGMPYKRLTLYRPPEVVFNDEVMQKFNGVDVTNGHPKSFVNSKSYRNLSSGVVLGAAYRDPDNPEFLMCDMIIKDASTIQAIEAGKVELSVGYTSNIVPQQGITPDGGHFDARIDSIDLVNHIAIVDRARAGNSARLLDGKEADMTKTIMIGAQEVELNDEVASAIETHIAEIQTQCTEKDEHIKLKDEEIGKRDARIAELEAELEETRGRLLDSDDIAKILKDADDLRTKAREIAGEAFVCDSFDPLEIKRAALVAVNDSLELDDKSEDYVNGFFEAALKSARAVEKQKTAESIGAAIMDGAPKREKSPEAIFKEKSANRWQEEN